VGGDYTDPAEWIDAKVLTTACAAEVPESSVGYDLGNAGMELDKAAQDLVLEAFTKTALPDAIIKGGATIQRVIVLEYPRVSEPGHDDQAEYVLVVESGK
jgi:hypothetical protein